MDNQVKYDQLADYLSDHLWMANQLDFDFLKQFPEFFYKGIGYRVLFLETPVEPQNFIHQSFAKTLTGAQEFIDNSQNFDKEFVQGKQPHIFQAEIEGFDVQLALSYFKTHQGLTEKTINAFIQEEEVLAFTCYAVQKIK